MADNFIYTTHTARIKPFLETIRGAGIPQRLTIKTIESFGFRSKNDRRLLAVLKAIGFIDQSGTPTKRWSQFRSKQTGGAALAAGVREHYASLFALYPDAYQKDAEALHAFFSSHTKVGEGTIKFMISTFRALCELADFESDSETSIEPPEAPAVQERAAIYTSVKEAATCTVNVNIQLTLPEGADAKTFDEFFTSMRKNLLDVV